MNQFAKYVVMVLLSGFFMTAYAVVQAQTMYSWTDENGVVHFSDVQPEGQQVQEQAIPQDKPSAAPNPYATPADAGPSAADQRRAEIAQKNQQAQADRAMKAAQCPGWESEVARLEPNRRVFFTNDQGETERMDDVERTNRVAELKSLIAQNCQ